MSARWARRRPAVASLETAYRPGWIPAALSQRRERTVSVCLPARNEAATVSAVVACCTRLRELGVVDEVVVIDDSLDGSAELAEAAGAVVFEQSALLPEFGPVRGRGDAMWRALSVLRGEVVVYLGADTADPGARLVTALLGPLLGDRSVRLVKGYYRRPFAVGGAEPATGGARVAELPARALLRRCFPELGAIRQPLAGEIAADRELLSALPFHLGDGVEVGLLIDATRACGSLAIAQADLRVGRHPREAPDVRRRRACAVADVILDKAAGLTPGEMRARPPMRGVTGT